MPVAEPAKADYENGFAALERILPLMPAQISRRDRKRILTKAIEAGDEDLVQQVSAEDPSLVNAGNAHGETALDYARNRKRAGIARLIEEHVAGGA